MRTLHDITDPRLVKALAHPLRIQILSILEERVASPSQIAEEIDAPLGNVSYHVRQLADLKLISLVKTTPVRGTLEHYYRAEMARMMSWRDSVRQIEAILLRDPKAGAG